MKTCRVCKLIKPKEDFFWQDKKSNRRRSDCKICSAITDKAYREANKKKLSEYNKNWKDSNKDKVKAYQEKHGSTYVKTNKEKMKDFLTGKVCNKCGFSDTRALQFHHIDPKNKVKNVNRLMTYSWSTIHSEILKCEILCANCHQIEHIIKSKSYRNNN